MLTQAKFGQDVGFAGLRRIKLVLIETAQPRLDDDLVAPCCQTLSYPLDFANMFRM
ncbi:hypothetical protein D9M72_603150 [compost metagenome]